MDGLAAALDALFEAPGSAAAVYHPPGGDPTPIRVIVSQPDQTAKFGDRRVILASQEVQMRRSEVSDPAAGARLIIAGAAFLNPAGGFTDTLRLMGDPLLDVEGLTWTCGATTTV